MYKLWTDEKGELQYEEFPLSQDYISKMNKNTDMIIELAIRVQDIRNLSALV